MMMIMMLLMMMMMMMNVLKILNCKYICKNVIQYVYFS